MARAQALSLRRTGGLRRQNAGIGQQPKEKAPSFS
jgi:hypothetical protein